ncbi:MAG TPA: CoA ester lyase [Anaerolineae bacterium]|nr:CoA ester lyase [Anaerolineae bacterium]
MNNSPTPALWGAHLFVPANNAGYLTKLPLIPIQHIILDLEYATLLAHKASARHLIRHAIPYLRELNDDLHICVRVNPVQAGTLLEEDLRLVVPAAPDAIRIPSVNHPDDVKKVDELVTHWEKLANLPPHSIALHPMIETPAGFRHAYAIAAASPRNQSLGLGGEDWAHNLGLNRTPAAQELHYLKAAIIPIAAEFNLAPIDSVYQWLDDIDGLLADCHTSLQLGYRGRATVNPRQIGIINQAYKPAPEFIAWAKNLTGGLQQQDVGGHTHYTAHDRLLDPLAVYQAQVALAHPAAHDTNQE